MKFVMNNDCLDWLWYIKNVAGLPRNCAPHERKCNLRCEVSMVRGQSLFELIVAIGLVSLILLALVGLATLSVRNASYSRNQAEASRIGQEGIEWLRLERDRKWSDFLSHATLTPTACIKGLSWGETHIGACQPMDKIDDLFYREAEFAAVDTDPMDSHIGFDRVQAFVTVYWTDSRGYHEIKNSTYFSDWKAQ